LEKDEHELEKVSSEEQMQRSATYDHDVDQQSEEDLTEIVDDACNVLDDIFLQDEDDEYQGHDDQDEETEDIPQTQVAAMEEAEDEQLEEDLTGIVTEAVNVLDDTSSETKNEGVEDYSDPESEDMNDHEEDVKAISASNKKTNASSLSLEEHMQQDATDEYVEAEDDFTCIMDEACDALDDIFSDDVREEDEDDQEEGDANAEEQEIEEIPSGNTESEPDQDCPNDLVRRTSLVSLNDESTSLEEMEKGNESNEDSMKQPSAPALAEGGSCEDDNTSANDGNDANMKEEAIEPTCDHDANTSLSELAPVSHEEGNLDVSNSIVKQPSTVFLDDEMENDQGCEASKEQPLSSPAADPVKDGVIHDDDGANTNGTVENTELEAADDIAAGTNLPKVASTSHLADDIDFSLMEFVKAAPPMQSPDANVDDTIIGNENGNTSTNLHNSSTSEPMEIGEATEEERKNSSRDFPNNNAIHVDGNDKRLSPVPPVHRRNRVVLSPKKKASATNMVEAKEIIEPFVDGETDDINALYDDVIKLDELSAGISMEPTRSKNPESSTPLVEEEDVIDAKAEILPVEHLEEEESELKMEGSNDDGDINDALPESSDSFNEEITDILNERNLNKDLDSLVAQFAQERQNSTSGSVGPISTDLPAVENIVGDTLNGDDNNVENAQIQNTTEDNHNVDQEEQ